MTHWSELGHAWYLIELQQQFLRKWIKRQFAFNNLEFTKKKKKNDSYENLFEKTISRD